MINKIYHWKYIAMWFILTSLQNFKSLKINTLEVYTFAGCKLTLTIIMHITFHH